MNCSAIVLAGGQSSRMGQDKALIPVNGVPMLAHVCQVALACVETVHIVTPWPERYRAIAPAACEFIQEVALQLANETSPLAPASESENISPLFGHGPLVGFSQGLPHVKTDWVLLLACDLPRLEAKTIQSWLPLLQDVPKNAIALLSQQKKGWEPLCGFYRVSCLGSLEAYIASGQRSFQSWLNRATVSPLPNFDESILFNCNTPVDLRKVQEFSSN